VLEAVNAAVPETVLLGVVVKEGVHVEEVV
jgi:hypothetical protein